MVEMPHFETYCLETGVKTLVTETGQQLPPSFTTHYMQFWIFVFVSALTANTIVAIAGSIICKML